MKKVLFLSTLIAAVLLASSCQKEQELVTLGAVISQTGKTYIDDRYPCWNNGDQVYVNNAAYPISAASGPSAQIADVVSADGYRALFPASLIPSSMDITNNGSIPVTLPATQLYTLVDGHQRVNAPMGAYTEGEVLQFHNLCSIVHVVVNNNTGSDMALDKLRIAADNAYLSGAGTATVTGADDDGITLSSEASHSVTLRIAGPTSVTLAAGAQSAFDIYVPAFPTDNVTITLYTTDGYYFEITKNGVALAPNTYTTVTLNVTSLTQILAAELVDGPTFNAAIPHTATNYARAVVFEYNSSVTSGTLLSTSNSPVPIYGNLDIDGRTWRVSTSASMINANPYCQEMFNHIYYLNTIDFGDGFNTLNVTNMKSMFQECRRLTSLNLSYFNTANVSDMSYMFYECSGLTSLDLSNFNTENVTDMRGMFGWCNLTSLDLSNFDTENVTDMSDMFKICSRLINLDLSNFNTANVTDMGGMFEQCSSLTSLDLSNFNTSNVTDMSSIFHECSSLTSLDLSNFNTANVTDMSNMFAGCSGLTSLDLSNFNTENVTDMSHMFADCSGLTSLDLPNFNTENVTDMSGMFGGCSSLTSLDLSNFNTANVEFMGDMFILCSGLTSINLSNFNTANVTNMFQMFAECSSLTSLDLSNFNTVNVTDMTGMFAGCFGLTSLDVSSFNTENVTSMSHMFATGTHDIAKSGEDYSSESNLQTLDLSNFNTSNVTDMCNMFEGCNSLISLDLSHFDMSLVTYKTYMCYGLSTTSGHCTITCPLAVQTELENGTELPTSGVTFTWVRPTSK